jgi:hypothetical protein
MSANQLKVKDLIKLLKKQDPEAKAVVEGCDCEDYCVGLSTKEDGEVVFRRERGVFQFDKLEVITSEK